MIVDIDPDLEVDLRAYCAASGYAPRSVVEDALRIVLRERLASGSADQRDRYVRAGGGTGLLPFAPRERWGAALEGARRGTVPDPEAR